MPLSKEIKLTTFYTKWTDFFFPNIPKFYFTSFLVTFFQLSNLFVEMSGYFFDIKEKEISKEISKQKSLWIEHPL